MELKVLGAIEAVSGGRAVQVGGPTARRLLAVLLARRREVVHADSLAEAVWGPAPPPTAHATLLTHVSKLRRAVGADGDVVLARRPPGYVLVPAEGVLDADRFEAELVAARSLPTTSWREALDVLETALGRWRGPAFAEFADDPSVRAEAVRLDELRVLASEVRIDACLAAGDPARVVGELEALIDEHPLRERFWAQLMLALARTGRQAEALRTAQRLRALLGDELGLEPSSELRALEQAIATGDPAVAATHVRPVGETVDARPVEIVPVPVVPERRAEPGPPLPAAAVALIGRDRDLEQLSTTSSRVVTLTGPGGVGKSSLVMEVARRSAHRFTDGVQVVELAAVRDAEGVLAGVAQALDVQRRPERSLEQSIVDVLRPRCSLLVVDNCEHVIATVGHLVSTIVRWCPAVRVLATSRQPLGMAGEQVWRVPPLAVPVDSAAPVDELMGSPAVELFMARAGEAAPGFRLDDGNARSVAQLCVSLDGMPLALELAAARMASMSPAQLGGRLDERWSLLGGGHGREPRHRNLLDVVQWSYELLGRDEQRLFDHLSVFAGGFELDAVERTCAEGGVPRANVAGLLSALVDKSLVVADTGADGIRYRQLETLRQYGAARLAERSWAPEVRRAHLRTFIDLAERSGAGLDGPEEGMWGDRLERELDNLRMGIRTAIAEGDADSALRIVAAARELTFRRIRYELVDWADSASRLPSAEHHELLPVALGIVGYGSFVRGELVGAVSVGEAAIASQVRLGGRPSALPERVLGNAHFYLGDHDRALLWMDRMVEAARASGDHGRVAHSLYMRSVAQTSVGDPIGGEHLAAEALEVSERLGNPTAAAQARYAAGLAVASRQPDVALDRLEQAADLAGGAGNHWMRAFAMTEAMWLRARRGDIGVALRGYREVVETWYRGGDWANQWLSLRQLAAVLGRIGRDHEAALLFGAVDAAGATDALPFAPTDAGEVHVTAADVDRRLGGEAATIRRRGAAMRDDAVVALALQAIDGVS